MVYIVINIFLGDCGNAYIVKLFLLLKTLFYQIKYLHN